MACPKCSSENVRPAVANPESAPTRSNFAVSVVVVVIASAVLCVALLMDDVSGPAALFALAAGVVIFATIWAVLGWGYDAYVKYPAAFERWKRTVVCDDCGEKWVV